jgi:hypothetical protein
MAISISWETKTIGLQTITTIPTTNIRTHIFLRYMHPKLEQARKDIWDQPDEDSIIMK